MHKSQQSIYSRNYKQWISVVKHRTGYREAPNAMQFAGYMHGSNGVPVPTVRIMRGATEVARSVGFMSYDGQFQDNDITQIRVKDVKHVASFYLRYNQVKELLVNLNDFTNLRNIGFRRNYVAGLGHQDLSNLQYLKNVDYSDNSSLTQITFHPSAPIDFFYLDGTSITQANVDYILQHAVNSGILNGVCTYSGRPSFDSIDNYATLVDRGWSMGLAPHTPTLEKFADTSTGVSNGTMIGASHKIPFTVRNADGSQRYAGSYSDMHPGDFPDFENNGWIEAYYHQPTILSLKFNGKQIKALYLDHLISLRFAEFDNNNIQSLNISNLTNLESLKLRYNPLASLNGVANNKITLLDVRDTNLGSTAIDQLLADLVTSGELDGDFLYSVRPTPAAVANYDILASRGWFLSLAPPRAASNLVVVSTGVTSASLSWTKGQYLHTVNESLDARVVGTTTWFNYGSASGNTATITDLQPNTSYEFRIGSVWHDLEPFIYSNTATGTTTGIVYNLTVNVTRNIDNTLKAVMDWDDIPGATQYQVQGDLHGMDPNTYPPGSWVDSFQQPQGTNSILIIDNEADVGGTYIVRVRAMVNGVWQNWSAEVTGNSPELPAPSPFTLSLGTVTSNSVALSWTASQYAATYRIMRLNMTDGGAPVTVATNITTLSYTDNTVIGGKEYLYQVDALNDSGTASTNGVTANTPAQISNPVIASATTGQEFTAGQNLNIFLEPYPEATSVTYNINGTDSLTSSTSPTFQVTIPAASVTVGTYTIFAKANVGGTIYNSEPITVYVVASTPAPSPATNLVFTNVLNNTLTISFTAGANTTGHRVLWRVAGSGSAYNSDTVATNVTTTTRNITGLAGNTNYEFIIRSYQGSTTTVDSATSTKLTRSNPVTGLTATVISSTQINLSWTAPANGVDAYDLERKIGSGGNWFHLTSLAGTSYSNTGLTPNTQYFYRVVSKNATGGTLSSEVVATTTTGSTLAINIKTPTEGQTISPTITSTFELNGVTGIEMTNITEGQTISPTITVNIKLN